jgi:ubiquinone/menaquinone biosynthesis C-methylase UbiE
MPPDPYRRIARYYDRIIEPMNVGLRSIGLAMHPPAPGMSVLDVGCGTGAHLAHYVDEGCRGFGIDASPAMLSRARERLGDRADLRLGSATELPFEDGSFDLVLAATLIHEMAPETHQTALGEIGRVLREDGRVLVIDFHAGSLRFPKGWWRRAVSVATELAAGRTHYRHYRAFMAAGGIPGLIADRFGVEQEKVVAGGNIGLYLLGV